MSRFYIKKTTKNLIKVLDGQLGTNLWGRLLKITRCSSAFLNAIRRLVCPAIIKAKYKLGFKDKVFLRLHLGCGNEHLPGYINIDWRKTEATDLVCDLGKLPFRDDSVRLIETYHVIGHLSHNDLPRVLRKWIRILIPSGKLIIECPNFDKAVKEYLEGREDRIFNIFGLQRFPGDTHLFGYNFKRLKSLLQNVGFEKVKEQKPTDYHSKEEPCLRVECCKGKN